MADKDVWLNNAMIMFTCANAKFNSCEITKSIAFITYTFSPSYSDCKNWTLGLFNSFQTLRAGSSNAFIEVWGQSPVVPLKCSYTSSSLSSIFGIPFTTGKRLPVSGHINAPSSRCTYQHQGPGCILAEEHTHSYTIMITYCIWEFMVT